MGVCRVALSGKMRAGKDTIADYLVVRYGFVKVSFADKLKEVAHDLFGKPATGKNRELLVSLGRKMCQIDKAVWVRQVLLKIPFNRDVVVSDLRFSEEYYALKALDFTMVLVTIDPEIQKKRILATDPTMPMEMTLDESESALEGWRFDAGIDGGLDWAYCLKAVDRMVEALRERDD